MNFTVQMSLPTVNRVLTAVHKLCSQAHFYYTLCIRVWCLLHWAVGGTARSVDSSCCFSMSSHLAVQVHHLPFTVIPHPTFTALHGMPSLPTAEPCVEMKPENTETKVSFSIQCEFQWWQTIHGVQCSLQHTVQLLIISWVQQGLIKPWR
jgi:hypothetical protein